MTTTRWAFVATLIVAWMPFGLIHQGQRLVNSKAQPIVPLLQQHCNPADPKWEGCR